MTRFTKLTTVLPLLDNKLPSAQILHDYCLTTLTPWQLPKPHNEFFFAHRCTFVHFSVRRTVHKITNNLLLIVSWIVEMCCDCLTTNYQLPKSFMITVRLLWLLDNYLTMSWYLSKWMYVKQVITWLMRLPCTA